MIRLGLLGSHGRMGTLIRQFIQTEFHSEIELAASARKGDPLEGLLSCDVVIDVSLPSVMSQLASLALQHPAKKLPRFVVGSTGWSPEQRQTLEALAKLTPTLISSNFSSGIFAVSLILKEYSPLLRRLGYTPVILDTHHQRKKDAPSGTARSLQSAINPNQPDEVQTLSIRAGEVIGDHEVIFFGAGDQITLTHHAQDRSIFARGAIEVAKWLTELQGPIPPSGQSQRTLGMDDFFRSLKTQTLGAPPHGNPL